MDILNDWEEIHSAEVQDSTFISGSYGYSVNVHSDARGITEKLPLDGDLKHVCSKSILSLSGKYCKILKITDISEILWN